MPSTDRSWKPRNCHIFLALPWPWPSWCPSQVQLAGKIDGKPRQKIRKEHISRETFGKENTPSMPSKTSLLFVFFGRFDAGISAVAKPRATWRKSKHSWRSYVPSKCQVFFFFLNGVCFRGWRASCFEKTPEVSVACNGSRPWADPSPAWSRVSECSVLLHWLHVPRSQVYCWNWFGSGAHVPSGPSSSCGQP